MPAGEVAFYGKKIDPVTLDQPLTPPAFCSLTRAKRIFCLGSSTPTQSMNGGRLIRSTCGSTAAATTFTRMSNTVRPSGAAGGDSTPFPRHHRSRNRTLATARLSQRPESLPWSLSKYDPQGNDGKGVVTATLNGDTAMSMLDEGHKRDGAAFNRFGILDVMKSYDLGSGGNVYFDNITVQGQKESFDADPQWDGRNNRRTWPSIIARPWFDFGFSRNALGRRQING